MRHSALVLLLLSCAPAETLGPDGKPLPRPDDPAISKADEVIVNGSRLKPYRNVYTSADGMRVEAVRIADFRDTKLNTDCGPSLGSDGVSRCYPAATALTRLFSDAACTKPVDIVVASALPCGGAPMPPEWLLTRAPGTCPSAVSGMYRKPVLNPISPAVKFYMMQATTCVGSYYTEPSYFLFSVESMGQQVPLTDFAEVKYSRE